MNTNISQFTPVEAIALIKAIAKEAKVGVSIDAKENKNFTVPVGNHNGSVAVKVAYALNKGEDYTQAPTADILSKAIIARALVNLGAQRTNFLNALKEAATEALVDKKKVADQVVAEDARVLEQIDILQKEVIAKLPRKSCGGKVTVVAQVARLDAAIKVAEMEQHNSAA